jgi:hypothetical protein
MRNMRNMRNMRHVYIVMDTTCVHVYRVCRYDHRDMQHCSLSFAHGRVCQVRLGARIWRIWGMYTLLWIVHVYTCIECAGMIIEICSTVVYHLHMEEYASMGVCTNMWNMRHVYIVMDAHVCTRKNVYEWILPIVCAWIQESVLIWHLPFRHQTSS